MFSARGEGRKSSLYGYFSTLPDQRRAQGKRHPLALVLTLAVMAVLSGCTGQRQIADFIHRHKEELREFFNVKRKELPSRKAMMEVFKWLDFAAFAVVFCEWSQEHGAIGAREWISIDGKVIGGTVTNADNPYQSYINLVSLFSAHRKKVIACDIVYGNKESEISVARTLIDELGIRDAVFTLDALHCQKDTVNTIVETGNDYVIGVKGNQPKLLKHIKKQLRSAV
jgi:DDE_Tnp_1-associated/Transposase DDE domain